MAVNQKQWNIDELGTLYIVAKPRLLFYSVIVIGDYGWCISHVACVLCSRCVDVGDNVGRCDTAATLHLATGEVFHCIVFHCFQIRGRG